MAPSARLAVAIATKGRAVILGQALSALAGQTRQPDRVLVCHTCEEDVAGVGPGLAEFMIGSASTTLQRNRMVDAATDCDIILFLDDDIALHPAYIAATLAAFDDPGIVVTTGTLAADGAKGPGLSFAQATSVLSGRSPSVAAPEPAFNGYGCNMAMRLSVMRDHDVRFDERMTFYAWYEDIDVTRRCGVYGRIVRLPGAVAVHLGVKLGRGSGVRLGYAQIVNPIYLCRKGSYLWSHALRSVGRHILINAVKSLRPEPYIDRRGRLWGNLRAVADLLRGRLQPERVRLL